MRNDKWITGLVLVLIGAAFLLNNLGYIDFHWGNVFRLWPVFLVMAGVSMVLANQREAWATVVKALVIVGGFAIILFADLGNRSFFWMPRDFHYQYDDDDDDDDEVTDSKGVVKVQGNSEYKQVFAPGTKVALLNISGGGTAYELKDTTANLFAASTKEFTGRYDLTNKQTDSLSVIDFKMRDRHGKFRFNWDDNDKNKSNTAELKLSTIPVWDINMNTGASSVEFDLTKFKLKSFKLNGGAASIDLKVGQPLAETRIEVSTGASEVNINVPQNAACSITTQSGLSSVDVNGFTKVGDNHYETPGFAAAKNKIYIKMSGGISDFNVNKY
ncbi:hypothetical protein EOD41_13565 [Mucilaginibacter limnophilus]|uniref:LiaI-LiaF-like transmembrane region domain-containing protein n=1 Tax=Mucilaginibacter limnophilus TaxID=1932778 RepID=A0A437MQR3_9SPHI|nr:DUF5668 domain-containing protein [Mucilaginibacter limnophilus]RVT99988.1 hypothetical protein EOD41_13565 [Mucilaginibacter limnophilus]